MQGLLKRFEEMAMDPLGHMSSLFASVLIGEPEMDSVQDTHENNIVRSVRETVVSWLTPSEIIHLEVSALSLLIVARCH